MLELGLQLLVLVGGGKNLGEEGEHGFEGYCDPGLPLPLLPALGSMGPVGKLCLRQVQKNN